ncbi:MAG: fibronectin type III domain-containing protein [Lachnospiraceae bacterium]|nr:fibronectin type III domain-containing protein [Lachnospiraceae bacterium]
MKGKTCWQERPHKSAFDTSSVPDICRMAPGENDLFLQWQDPVCGQRYQVAWRSQNLNQPWQSFEVEGCEARIEGLTSWMDYEVRVVRQDGTASKTRQFKPAPVPGTVINYLHPKDNRYAFSGKTLGSPSMVRLPSGALIAGMDVFAGGAPQNLSMLFRSEDDGATWTYLCELYPLFWGNLFVHNGRLYVMGCSTEYGDLVIGASDDEGYTWTVPTRIFYGSSTVGAGWQQATMPVLRHGGRLWFAVEYAGHGAGVEHAGNGMLSGACVVSVPQDADLLDPASWSATLPVGVNHAWPGAPAGEIRSIAEGSLIVDRSGEIHCILRLNMSGHDPRDSYAVVLRVDEKNPEAPMTFVRYISMPSGFNSKTHILYDAQTDLYLAIGNICTDPAPMFQRKVLSLMVSKDAQHWRVAANLLDYSKENSADVGFQYPSWFIDGDDILMQVRTAINGSRNFHDANYSTFHRIEHYKELLS